MNLVIDKGNTRMKFALFQGNDLLYKGFSEADLALLPQTPFGGEMLEVLLSASGGELTQLPPEIQKNVKHLYRADPEMDLPLILAYKTPKTLGFDRIAGSVGARFLFPEASQLLVIDAGSAVTFDRVSGQSFLGGSISPGLRMRSHALHSFTEHLPEIEIPSVCPEYGDSTHDAIASGVVNGMIFEVEGYRNRFLSAYPNGQVILTGGDAELLKPLLSDGFYCFDNLVLIGLNQILTHILRLIL